MRIDRLFCFLRFARTRSLSHHLIEEGHIRRNGVRVCRASQPVEAGDVLTFPWGDGVRVIELLGLPTRRGPPAEAQTFYRTLDQQGQTAIAPVNSTTASNIQD